MLGNFLPNTMSAGDNLVSGSGVLRLIIIACRNFCVKQTITIIITKQALEENTGCPIKNASISKADHFSAFRYFFMRFSTKCVKRFEFLLADVLNRENILR